MLSEDGKKLWALNYAERKKIVNSKTIEAIQAGIEQGYNTFDKQDCLNRLVKSCEGTIESENMNYQYTGKCNTDALEKAKKNLELLKQIEL